MSRFVFLLSALLLFCSLPYAVHRFDRVPARWRLRFAFLTVLGLLTTWAAFLAAIVLPEILVASGPSEIWRVCMRAFHAVFANPLGRFPSLIAAVLLAYTFGRFGWSLLLGARATARARIKGGDPRWRLSSGAPVYVLQLDEPEAYSVGALGSQVVLSEGLLSILDPDERRSVLLHEEAHLRSFHHLILGLARAASSALPLPPAQRALSLVEQSAEEAADEYAASRIGDAAVVASSLSKAALAGLRAMPATVSLASGPDVPARVRRLLSPTKSSGWMIGACVAAMVGLVVVLSATQAIAGLAVIAAAHHVLGMSAVFCPTNR